MLKCIPKVLNLCQIVIVVFLAVMVVSIMFNLCFTMSQRHDLEVSGRHRQTEQRERRSADEQVRKKLSIYLDRAHLMFLCVIVI